MKAAKDLIIAWFGSLSMRRALNESRTRLGIEHARFNREVVLLEEELMSRFGGSSHFLPDGRLLDIGKPGCRLGERMKITGVSAHEPQIIVSLPSWAECEAKCDAGTATPIERFIYDNEPADGLESVGLENSQSFRRSLALALGYAHTNFLL